MQPAGDGGDESPATTLVCGSCGAQCNPAAKFCSECGTRLTQSGRAAEYKQVTVLFADVVHSMGIATAVGAERLREIMTNLVDRSSAVIKRYGGTVDKFTGDGIMAVFGAPVALEDHALRACLAALGLQDEAKRLAVDIHRRHGLDLLLRVGLNSGQVIAGEIGSGPFGYTAVGEQVGMAQRMESIAPPSGVMLSASTARLVEASTTLGDPQMARIKGSSEEVPTRQLFGVAAQPTPIGRAEANLVGRQWEVNTIAGILARSISGKGCVVGVAGPAGIGKSRLAQEAATIARHHGIDVFWTLCESHASDVPFHVVARMLRNATGIADLSDEAARTQIRQGFPGAADDDLLLLDDLLRIRDPAVPLPAIEPMHDADG